MTLTEGLEINPRLFAFCRNILVISVTKFKKSFQRFLVKVK